MVSHQCDYVYVTVNFRFATKFVKDILVVIQLHIRLNAAFACFQRYNICRVFTQSGCTHVFSSELHCATR